MQPQNRQDAMPRWPLPFYNGTGGDLPAFAIFLATGSGGLGAAISYTASLPTAGFAALCLIAGPLPVPAGNYGKATGDFPAVVLYNADGGADPVAGDEWGPTGADFAIHRTGKGFIIDGGVDATNHTVHVMRAAGSETYRLIRGQSYGVQSGALILIRNVVVLSGGLDPTNGNPAIFVRVANFFSQSYANNQWIDAVYSPNVSLVPPADWETLSGSAGLQAYTLVQGQCTADVTPQATSFDINHIELLSGSLDPRTVPGSTTEHLTIIKPLHESFRSGDFVTAVHFADDSGWELLLVERNRAVRGKFLSDGGSTIEIDHIVALDSGIDPRLDPTDDTETLEVTKIASDTFSVGEDVWADYNAKTGVWEARPKVASGDKKGVYKANSDIPAATDMGGVRTPGSSTDVTKIKGNAAGGSAFKNWSLVPISADSYLVAEEIEDVFVIYSAFC